MVVLRHGYRGSAYKIKKSERVYWAAVKRRNPELIAICKQLKLKAGDGKFYNEIKSGHNGLYS